MTIDTNELRRLAQAATPGPWYVTGKLTRYVEARIDGGLIQEVAACGPTKADGGYGPQQEANARLLAAANPATISEFLNRLEAVEKERDWHAERCEDAMNECAALRVKIEAMEKQEPLDAGSDVFRSAFEAALKAGNWPATRQGDDYRSPSTQIAWRIAFSTVNRLKLYLAPGAQGEEE